MKHLTFLLMLATILMPACGDSETKSKRKKPPIIRPRVSWLVSHQEAVEQSKQTGKPIFAFFTGSDWCKYCELLDHQVLNTEIFANWAKQNVVLLELDFPRNKEIPPERLKVNQALQKQYHVSGLPSIIFLMPDGSPILKTGYAQVTAAQWVEVVDKKLKESLARYHAENSGKQNPGNNKLN